jgi:hypothetical protein
MLPDAPVGIDLGIPNDPRCLKVKESHPRLRQVAERVQEPGRLDTSEGPSVHAELMNHDCAVLCDYWMSVAS